MIEQLSLFAQSAPTAPPPAGLPDERARRRIREDLSTNLLVEAGAGAGKTTEMVRRMVALVATGTAQAGHIAAVTFTRKAAAELRERFQTAVEKELHHARSAGRGTEAERLDAALRDIDSAFLGTIHAFCARLLRERPLEAGIDPGFRELLNAEEVQETRRFWREFVERAISNSVPSLSALREVGLEPRQVEALFEELVGQPDVEYPATHVPRPSAGALRSRIDPLLDRALSLMPAVPPRGGYDPLQRAVRILHFNRDVLGWGDDPPFLDLLAGFGARSWDVKPSAWKEPESARALSRELQALFAAGGPVDTTLRQWWAHRYPIALQFARDAATEYEQERRRAGTLNFQDLLMFAARLLRDSPAARRELSDRYRFLLVDEFQDTDPIQAEVLFLLASDETLDFFGSDTDEPREFAPPLASWRHLMPRPGALFVVGDPKQSIYRFRRADMTLYKLVRQRFASGGPECIGAVVELTANFRSRTPIERFVNETFRTRFTEEGSEKQAPFAPMRVLPSERAAPAEGVFWYMPTDPAALADTIVHADAGRLATWIAERIASGERAPGDFLILTPHTKRLAVYASALEHRNVPLQVAGAGVGAYNNAALFELRTLLAALADPSDSALSVAVLVGLFFGLDYELLVQHVEQCEAAGRRRAFSFTRTHPPLSGEDSPRSLVENALATLHRWWRWTRTEPCDVAVARIVRESGLLPFAASGELGESRAGALIFAMEAVRNAAFNGDSSVQGALNALDAALDEADAEAPLEPGRADVVRLMNVHKAKGLEARVVVLAMPSGHTVFRPKRRIIRDAAGHALGYHTLKERHDRQDVTLAQPLDWDDHEAIEQEYANAEEDRLLYVAATRAAEELVVATGENPWSQSRWRSFHEWLFEHGTPLQLPEASYVSRARLQRSAEELTAATAAADSARLEHARPGYRAAAVTARKAEFAAAAAGGDEPVMPAEPTSGTESVVDANAAGAEGAAAEPVERRGTEWGTVVHDALLAVAQGVDGEMLRTLCRNLLVSNERPSGEDGEPIELEELLATIAAVQGSAFWQRSLQSGARHVEVPFAVRFTAAEYAAIAGNDRDAAPIEIVEGRVDLAFREEDGWVIVDYKTDAAGAAIPETLRARYDAQLQLYSACWERLTGERVKEAVLLFTADEVQRSGR